MKLAGIFLVAGLAFGANQNSYIVDTDPASLNGVLARHSLALDDVIKPGIYRVTSSPNVPGARLLSDLDSDSAVTGAEDDSTVHTPETPQIGVAAAIQPSLAAISGALANHSTITYYGSKVRSAYVNQQATGIIEMLGALSRFGTGNTTVAVIDTGVDPNHPALKGALVSGYDFTRKLAGPASELLDLNQSTVAILEQSTVAILEQKNSPAILSQSTVAILEQSTVAILEGAKLPSDFGHGTMVAGLIHLVAPGARIMPLKAFAADGSSNLSNIIQAVYYAVDHKAKVINMSFAMQQPSAELAKAIAFANSKGVICIASAGNDGKQVVVYPAASAGVIGVGSTSAADLRSTFSNYGSASARTAAPGEALITTYPGNNYAAVWGTSFSSALVAGAATLMAQLYPGISSSAVADALDHGTPIHQGMGDARLQEVASLLYLLVGGN